MVCSARVDEQDLEEEAWATKNPQPIAGFQILLELTVGLEPTTYGLRILGQGVSVVSGIISLLAKLWFYAVFTTYTVFAVSVVSPFF
ncbi:MAG: hypothetical protein M1318_06785, partial [Firmicutes bacterium]|nr:hypothetical protein [Bacillota bacterium]